MVVIVKGESVCVTGAAGYVGSWLVKRLLERGYVVHATVMDPNNMKEVGHLLDLPNAKTNLRMWKADLNEEGSFDEAIKGCEGVFHLATPMDFNSKDHENEVIKPTVNGILDIMKSCLKWKVRKLIFTSSAGTVNIEEKQKPVYDENCWSDVDFCRRVKMTGWVYFVAKTLAEQAAWKFAEENKLLDLITIMPTIVVGPFIIPTFPPSFITSLSLITRNKDHYTILKQGQYVHLDDLCMSHIYLYEKPDSKGRYICSSHDATIYELGDMLRSKYPEYHIPTKFRDFDEKIERVSFSSKKLVKEGFEFKYSLEDMFAGAVETCREKGLLPKSLHDEVEYNVNGNGH